MWVDCSWSSSNLMDLEGMKIVHSIKYKGVLENVIKNKVRIIECRQNIIICTN